MANDTVYGLSAAVFTESSSRGIRVAHALESGQTFVRVSGSVVYHLIPRHLLSGKLFQ